jgi:hypothetical protein
MVAELVSVTAESSCIRRHDLPTRVRCVSFCVVLCHADFWRQGDATTIFKLFMVKHGQLQ